MKTRTRTTGAEGDCGRQCLLRASQPSVVIAGVVPSPTLIIVVVVVAAAAAAAATDGGVDSPVPLRVVAAQPTTVVARARTQTAGSERRQWPQPPKPSMMPLPKPLLPLRRRSGRAHARSTARLGNKQLQDHDAAGARPSNVVGRRANAAVTSLSSPRRVPRFSR